MMKKFGVWWLRNTVNILNTTGLYIRKWLNDNYYVMHILPQLEGNTNAEHEGGHITGGKRYWGEVEKCMASFFLFEISF